MTGLRPRAALAAFLALELAAAPAAWARTAPAVTARAAIVVDARNGGILYSKNPHLRLPPASTTKVMTVLIALERLPLDRWVRASKSAVSTERSKAGLEEGAEYRAKDLVMAALVASSNDAAVALAEAVAGSEAAFAKLMNAKAAKLGMKNTRFVNSTGLPDKKRSQYSTAYDLTLLMRHALRDRRVDQMMGITETSFRSRAGKVVPVKSHNKMLWRTPKYVKGKTGWTFASRHTFVGTDYAPRKTICFAMLSSTEPWTDIERLADIGHRRLA